MAADRMYVAISHVRGDTSGDTMHADYSFVGVHDGGDVFVTSGGSETDLTNVLFTYVDNAESIRQKVKDHLNDTFGPGLKFVFVGE